MKTLIYLSFFLSLSLWILYVHCILEHTQVLKLTLCLLFLKQDPCTYSAKAYRVNHSQPADYTTSNRLDTITMSTHPSFSYFITLIVHITTSTTTIEYLLRVVNWSINYHALESCHFLLRRSIHASLQPPMLPFTTLG